GNTVLAANKTFFVNLTTTTNASIGDGQGVGKINSPSQLCSMASIDFDGDCKSDIGIYRDGAWSIVRSSDGSVAHAGWGGPSWIPVPAVYDGEGITDIAVYSPAGVWSIVRSSDGGNTVVGWGGAPDDIPVPADYDGDGKADIAIYRDGTWSIRRSSDGGITIVGWGGPSWIPVPA